MSIVNLFVIKGNRIYFIRKHYRKVQEMLKNQKDLSKEDYYYLDAGYLVLDLNNKSIINSQMAFTISQTEFYTIENLK